MKEKKDIRLCVAIFFCLVPLCMASENPPPTEPIIIDYFFETECSECEKIEKHILPRLEQEYQGQYRLLRHDVGIESNALAFFELESRLGITNKTMSCMVIEQKYCFDGYAGIKDSLFTKLAKLISDRHRGATPESPLAAPSFVNGSREPWITPKTAPIAQSALGEAHKCCLEGNGVTH